MLVKHSSSWVEVFVDLIFIYIVFCILTDCNVNFRDLSYNVAGFKRKIKSVQSDRHRVLNLVRGFFFWLQVNTFFHGPTYNFMDDLYELFLKKNLLDIN